MTNHLGPAALPTEQARRVALLNNKGGVGKTLLAAAIAECAALDGHRVLAVDMDPQANLTRRLAVTLDDQALTMTDVLRPGLQVGAAAAAIRPCGWSDPHLAGRIDVVPADLDLEDRSLEAGIPGAMNRLRKALYGADDGYDLVLVDCAPSLKGHLTGMSLACLDEPKGSRGPDTVLIPSEAEQDSVTAARRVAEYVSLYREDLGVPHLVAAGIVVNKLRPVILHTDRVDDLGRIPGVPVWGEPIGLRTRIGELQDLARPLRSDRDIAGSAAMRTLRDITRRLLALPPLPDDVHPAEPATAHLAAVGA
nr:ParA family protein [Micromonospora sp. DSM 115978]